MAESNRVQLARPRSDVEELIDRHFEEGRALRERGDELLKDERIYYDEEQERVFREWVHDLERWHARTSAALEAAYTTTLPSREFWEAVTGYIFRRVNQPTFETIRNRNEATERGLNTLRSLKERLEYTTAFEPPRPDDRSPSLVRTVFIVHGHDEGLREQVARLLELLDFEAVILLEHPHKGRTLIEKFESKAINVGYAVVLLTPDDWAKERPEDHLPASPNRARQNVILELGYFMGRLGRDRVTALYKPPTVPPTDIHGLGYHEIDQGGAWRLALAQELAAAGYDVDLNRLKKS